MNANLLCDLVLIAVTLVIVSVPAGATKSDESKVDKLN